MKINDIIVEQTPAVYRSGRAPAGTPYTTATQAGLTGTQSRPGVLRKAAGAVGRGTQQAARAAASLGRAGVGKVAQGAKTLAKSPITVPTAITKKARELGDPSSMEYQGRKITKDREAQERASIKVVDYVLSFYDKKLKDQKIDPTKEPNKAKLVLAQLSAQYFAEGNPQIINQIKQDIKNLPAGPMTRSTAEQFLKKINQVVISKQQIGGVPAEKERIGSIYQVPTKRNQLTYTKLPTSSGTVYAWYHPTDQKWYQYFGSNWPLDYQFSQVINNLSALDAIETEVEKYQTRDKSSKIEFLPLTTKGRRRSKKI